MKILITAMAIVLSISAYASTFENVAGEYEVTYSNKILFFGEEGSFKLTLKEIDGKYGDVTFESDATGFCTNDIQAESEYGYAVFDNTVSSYSPLKVKKPTRVLADFFCPKWHQLVIEVRPGELEKLKKGESTDVGFYLRDQTFSVILESKGKIQRLQ